MMVRGAQAQAPSSEFFGMNESERIERLPIELPEHLRGELRRVYRYMLFRGRHAGTVSGILNAVKEGQADWMSVLYQQTVVLKDSVYPRCYWRAMAIGVPDVLVVAHTMKVFGDMQLDAAEQDVFTEIKDVFEFKLKLAGASEKLPIEVRIMAVLNDVTERQAAQEQRGNGLDFSFSYNKRLKS